MMVLLGDEITLMKGDTWITGPCSGIVLDDQRELDRLYIHGIDMPFYLSAGWKLVEEDDDTNWNEGEDDEI
jgi:hypothetical protein